MPRNRRTLLWRREFSRDAPRSSRAPAPLTPCRWSLAVAGTWSRFLSLLVVGLPHARRRDDDLAGERSNSRGNSHEDRSTGRMGASGLFDCKRRSRIRARRGTVGATRHSGRQKQWAVTALVNSTWLLGNTRKLVIASGIANIFARDGMAMAARRVQLNEQSGGRFLLGMGISHAPIVSAIRGHIYENPVTTMRTYVEAMAHAEYSSPRPSDSTLTVIAALGPKMLALARDFADGAHPCNTTVAQTAAARAVLGPNKLLCVEQKVLLETNAARAREIARAYLRPYLRLPNYVNSWRRAGFDDSDFADNGSNRLVDTLVAWGDEDALVGRIRGHWQASADHVCIQALYADPSKSTLDGPNVDLIQRLAPLARESNTAPSVAAH